VKTGGAEPRVYSQFPQEVEANRYRMEKSQDSQANRKAEPVKTGDAKPWV